MQSQDEVLGVIAEPLAKQVESATIPGVFFDSEPNLYGLVWADAGSGQVHIRERIAIER